MKKLYCILILLFSVHSSYAQKISFTDTTNEWICEYTNWGGPITKSYTYEYYTGAVLKNGVTYLKTNKGRLYRHDTLSNIIYLTSSSGTSEVVLYNFNLKLNDTFGMLYSPLYGGVDSAIVYKIDSVLIRNTWHKKWHLRGIFGGVQLSEIIDGIGLYSWYSFEQSCRLVCFKNSITEPDSTGGIVNSSSCKLTVSNVEKHLQYIIVAPNPANESSKIILPYKIQSGSLSIVNAMGQVVLQKDFQNKEQLVLGALPAEGLYFYTVIDKLSNDFHKGKFLYQ